MLWTEKYAYSSLSQFQNNLQSIATLKKMVKTGNIPHTILYGETGSLKKTAARCLINDLFGKENTEINHFESTFDVNKVKRTAEFSTSKVHIEISPADYGPQDRYVISYAVKELIQIKSLVEVPYKIVIINDADKLTKGAQQALRRIMEKNAHNNRFILCCTNLTNILKPIISRCITLKFFPLTIEDATHVLDPILLQEEKTISPEAISALISRTKGNLTHIINVIQSISASNDHIDIDQVEQIVDPHVQHIKRIIALSRKADPQEYENIRKAIFALYFDAGLSAREILLLCTTEIVADSFFSVYIKGKLIQSASFYDHRLSTSNQDMVHLAAYFTEMMAIISNARSEKNV